MVGVSVSSGFVISVLCKTAGPVFRLLSVNCRLESEDFRFWKATSVLFMRINVLFGDNWGFGSGLFSSF